MKTPGYIGNTFAVFLVELPRSIVAERLVGPDNLKEISADVKHRQGMV